MKPPTIYKEMVDEAITIDNRLYELRLEGGGPRSSGRGRGAYNQRGYHFKGRKDYGNPMDLDAIEYRYIRKIGPGRGRNIGRQVLGGRD